MRLRNIPRAEGVLKAHPIVVKDGREYRGRWALAFGNAAPLHVEIGMGKGTFLLTLARENPGVNYIGIERYSSVLLRAVEKYEEYCAGAEPRLPEEGRDGRPAIHGGLANLRFLCMDARGLEEVFAPGEVERIYLNFSDPWPKTRHARRRLTSREFFGRYEKVLADGGRVEFKTDNSELFSFSLGEAESAGWNLLGYTWDLHADANMNAGNVMTEYEAKFSGMGHAIHKLIAGKGKPHGTG